MSSCGETSPQPRRALVKDQLSLRRVKGADGLERCELVPVADCLSFDKGFFLCLRAVQMLRDALPPGGLVIVALAGPSGAGKTVFSEKLCALLPGSALLTMDMYNDGSRVINQNYDDERLTDYHTLLGNIASLRAGQPAQVPIYDFKTSQRVGARTVPVPTSRVVVLEGIYALSSTLRPLVDLRVAVKGGVHLDLLKRVLRDVTRSGQAPEDIISQISETVYPMYKAFIEPDLQTAHLQIQNKFNPFSGFANPTYILKARAGPELTEEAVSSALGWAPVSEGGTTDIYLLPPHEDPASCATWLRMRSRDGRYTLVFEEFVTDGPFIISPNVRFEVNVRILGGLMALGYTIGVTLKRSTVAFADELVTVKLDTIESDGSQGGAAPGFPPSRFIQIQGRLRAAVEEAARKVGITDGACVPASYIQLVQAHMLGSNTLRAQHGTPRTAADALSLLGVSSPREAPYSAAATPQWPPDAPAPSEWPPTPCEESPEGGRIAALCARVDRLAEAMQQLQMRCQPSPLALQVAQLSERVRALGERRRPVARPEAHILAAAALGALAGALLVTRVARK